MTEILIASCYFVLIVLSNSLSIAWLTARDSGKALRAANIDALKELVDWVPIISFVIYQKWYFIAVGVAANWVASFYGIRHTRFGLKHTQVENHER